MSARATIRRPRADVRRARRGGGHVHHRTGRSRSRRASATREVVTEGPLPRRARHRPRRRHRVHARGRGRDARRPLAARSRCARWCARPGRLLATVATANDVHFGETECGRTGDPATDAIGPILSVAPGEEPYPLVMGRARGRRDRWRIDPDAVVVKGDLTDTGRAEEYAQFLDGVREARRSHAPRARQPRRDARPDARDLRHALRGRRSTGVTLAVLDTDGARSGRRRARSRRSWAGSTTSRRACDVAGDGVRAPPAVGSRRAPPVDPNYVIARDDSARLLDADRTARPHRRVLRRATRTRTACCGGSGRATCRWWRSRARRTTPGVWAEYRCYEGGYTQVMRRIAGARRARAGRSGAAT